MEVNILGTPYKIEVYDSGYLWDINADGECREFSKTILVRDLNGYLSPGNSAEEKELRRREVLRHELVHAFFNEAGLPNYSSDEVLVHWLAVQFPKMYQAFDEAGALSEPNKEVTDEPL